MTVGFRGVLNFGAIANECVLVVGELKLLGVRVIPLEAEFGDLFVHGEAKILLGVVPLDIDA